MIVRVAYHNFSGNNILHTFSKKRRAAIIEFFSHISTAIVAFQATSSSDDGGRN